MVEFENFLLSPVSVLKNVIEQTLFFEKMLNSEVSYKLINVIINIYDMLTERLFGPFSFHQMR